jgi:integrase
MAEKKLQSENKYCAKDSHPRLPANVISREGRLYYRCRVINNRRLTIRLPDICSPNFAAEYERAKIGAHKVRSSTENKKLAGDEPTAGSFSEPIRRYRHSELKAHTHNTQRSYEHYLTIFEKSFSDKSVASLKAPTIIRMRESMAATPGKARNFLAVLKVALNFAVTLGMIEVNPCDKVRKPRVEEHKPWPQEVLDRALSEAPPMLRLAIQTTLYSGQRIGDIIDITHAHMQSDPVVIKQQKKRSSGARSIEAVIPIHPGWIEAINQVERRAETILYNRWGKPFTNTEALQYQMRRLMNHLGYRSENGYGVEYTFHRLPKNAANYLAEVGCSPHEIGSICGMSIETVTHYTRGVMKKNLAELSRSKFTPAGPVTDKRKKAA